MRGMGYWIGAALAVVACDDSAPDNAAPAPTPFTYIENIVISSQLCDAGVRRSIERWRSEDDTAGVGAFATEMRDACDEQIEAMEDLPMPDTLDAEQEELFEHMRGTCVAVVAERRELVALLAPVATDTASQVEEDRFVELYNIGPSRKAECARTTLAAGEATGITREQLLGMAQRALEVSGRATPERQIDQSGPERAVTTKRGN